MLKKMVNGAKKTIQEKGARLFQIFASVITGICTFTMPVYASYTAPIDNLKTVLITIAASIGGVLLVWGIIQFAISFKKQDQNGEHSAVFSIAAGAVMLAAGVIVGVLGA